MTQGTEPVPAYKTLREANIARHAEWTSGHVVDLTWRGTELAGEIAELSELMFSTTLGYKEFCAEVSDEFADGWICLDLTLMTAGMLPVPFYRMRETTMTGPMFAAQLGILSGRVCNTLKKLERERRGWPGSRTSMHVLNTQADDLARILLDVIHLLGVSPAEAVARKFNATSEKVGLQTRLAVE